MAEMSVIMITPDNYWTVQRTMTHLRAQTARDQLEIVIAAPSADRLELDESVPADFAAVRIVEIGQMDSTARARAAGIRAATAPVVVLTEDHSFPEPGWADALIRAHREEWAAVGPVLLNANPRSLLSWANLVIEYNEWLDPRPGDVVSHVPGHNSSYKRDVLLSYGDDLEKWLEAETVLHWDLQARGHRLYLEPSAKLRHLNFSRLSSSLSLRFNGGRQFAGMRADGWPSVRRIFYAVAAPMIPFVRLRRILRELRRPGRRKELIPRLLPLLLTLLAFDAAGEMIGYALGVGSAAQKITEVDFHRERFMNRQDRQRHRALRHFNGQ